MSIFGLNQSPAQPSAPSAARKKISSKYTVPVADAPLRNVMRTLLAACSVGRVIAPNEVLLISTQPELASVCGTSSTTGAPNTSVPFASKNSYTN